MSNCCKLEACQPSPSTQISLLNMEKNLMDREVKNWVTGLTFCGIKRVGHVGVLEMTNVYRHFGTNPQGKKTL
jgi:hypothetical protein